MEESFVPEALPTALVPATPVTSIVAKIPKVSVPSWNVPTTLGITSLESEVSSVAPGPPTADTPVGFAEALPPVSYTHLTLPTKA